MSRCGDVYENRVTGEHALILRGTEDRGNGPGIAHLTARPGAVVVGAHFHPYLTEKFTVLKGRLDARIAGQHLSLGSGQSATVQARVAHDWWNGSQWPLVYLSFGSVAPTMDFFPGLYRDALD